MPECRECGNQLDEGARYCIECGGQVRISGGSFGTSTYSAADSAYPSLRLEAEEFGAASDSSLNRFVSPSGRVNRTSFFLFVVGSVVLYMVLAVIDISMGTFDEQSGLGLLSGCSAVALFWPATAAEIKRFHDQDISGWAVLLTYIPIVGFVIFLMLLFRGGTDGPNRFGQEPAGIGL